MSEPYSEQISEQNNEDDHASTRLNEQPLVLVEDDLKLAELISEYLERNGFSVIHFDDGTKALTFLEKSSPLLTILDIMLPGVDGLTICRRIRERSRQPIIMLTALSDDIDEVAGLETGADAYLGKPIKPRVLLAHIRALLRRVELDQSRHHHQDTESVIYAGDVKIDSAKRAVWVKNSSIDITSAEFDLLWILALQKGQIVSRDDLHFESFQMEYDGLDRNIDIRISRIRKKLGDDPKTPHIIKTVRGKGYILAD